MTKSDRDKRRSTKKPLGAQIALLERRCEHLQRRCQDPTRRRSSIDYDMAEVVALENAIAAMRRLKVEYQMGQSAIDILERYATLLGPIMAEGSPLPSGLRDLFEDMELYLEEYRTLVR